MLKVAAFDESGTYFTEWRSISINHVFSWVIRCRWVDTELLPNAVTLDDSIIGRNTDVRTGALDRKISVAYYIF